MQRHWFFLSYFSLSLSVYAISHYLYSNTVIYIWILFYILTRLFQIACKLHYPSQSDKNTIYLHWKLYAVLLIFQLEISFPCHPNLILSLFECCFFTTQAYQLLSSFLPNCPEIFLDIFSTTCHLNKLFVGTK